jgi:hypothetical protein
MLFLSQNNNKIFQITDFIVADKMATHKVVFDPATRPEYLLFCIGYDRISSENFRVLKVKDVESQSRGMPSWGYANVNGERQVGIIMMTGSDHSLGDMIVEDTITLIERARNFVERRPRPSQPPPAAPRAMDTEPEEVPGPATDPPDSDDDVLSTLLKTAATASTLRGATCPSRASSILPSNTDGAIAGPSEAVAGRRGRSTSNTASSTAKGRAKSMPKAASAPKARVSTPRASSTPRVSNLKAQPGIFGIIFITIKIYYFIKYYFYYTFAIILNKTPTTHRIKPKCKSHFKAYASAW